MNSLVFEPKRVDLKHSLPRSTNSSVWLNRSCEAWELLPKDEYVDENAERQHSPKLKRKKNLQNSVNLVIARLEQFPLKRRPDMQLKISHLIDLVSGMANADQVKRLKELEFTDRVYLKIAIREHNLAGMLEVPESCWTKKLFRKVNFQDRQALIEEWASKETPETCLRESTTALYQFVKFLVPQPYNAKIFAVGYMVSLFQLWNTMPQENRILLHLLQANLPVKEIDGIPFSMYFAFVFVWFPQHAQPKLLMDMLRRHADYLTRLWHKEERTILQ